MPRKKCLTYAAGARMAANATIPRLPIGNQMPTGTPPIFRSDIRGLRNISYIRGGGKAIRHNRAELSARRMKALPFIDRASQCISAVIEIDQLSLKTWAFVCGRLYER